SAVGHETDITISDMVADLRAPTPTAAAELAAPSQVELLEKMDTLNQLLQKSLQYKLKQYDKQLSHLEESYVFRYPGRFLEEKEQKLDRILERHDKRIEQILQQKQDRFEYSYQRFKRFHFLKNIDQLTDRINQLHARMDRAMLQHIHIKR